MEKKNSKNYRLTVMRRKKFFNRFNNCTYFNNSWTIISDTNVFKIFFQELLLFISTQAVLEQFKAV